MNSNIQNKDSVESKASNFKEITNVFKRLQIESPEERSYFNFDNAIKTQPQFVISYSSTTGGPLRDA